MTRPATSRSRDGDAAIAAQTAVLVVGAGLYFWYSARFVSDHLWRAAVGAVAILGAYELARRLGPAFSPGREPIAMFVGAMIFFVMPVAVGSAPRGHGFVAGAIGGLVAQGSWALFRYPYEPTQQATGFLSRSPVDRIRTAAKVGLVMAGALSIFATAVILIAAVASPEQAVAAIRDLGYVVGGYVGAGIVGGAVIGALAPLIRWPLGAVTLGIPLTGAIYGSVAIAMTQMTILNRGRDVRDIGLLAAIVVLTYIGPMWGVMAKEWIEE